MRFAEPLPFLQATLFQSFLFYFHLWDSCYHLNRYIIYIGFWLVHSSELTVLFQILYNHPFHLNLSSTPDCSYNKYTDSNYNTSYSSDPPHAISLSPDHNVLLHNHTNQSCSFYPVPTIILIRLNTPRSSKQSAEWVIIISFFHITVLICYHTDISPDDLSDKNETSYQGNLYNQPHSATSSKSRSHRSHCHSNLL